MLEAGNRCSIYEDRPLICRHYHDDGCDDSEGGYEYDEEFTSPEQLDAYARKRLGKARYAKDKKAFRARAARAVTKKKD
jgi:Fe-S-cluster containining protein